MLQAKPSNFVEVAPIAGFERSLWYRVPDEMLAKVQVGVLVRISIKKRMALGIITSVTDQCPIVVHLLKPLSSLVYETPIVTSDVLELIPWMARYYGVSNAVVLDAVIPSKIKQGMGHKKKRLLKLSGKLDRSEEEKLSKKAPKQWALFQELKQTSTPQDAAALTLRHSPCVIKALVDKGLILEETSTLFRSAYDDEHAMTERVTTEAPILTQEQSSVFACIKKSIESKLFNVHLLHGVTGSGKTEVYLKAIEQVLSEGGSVLFLVPEVVLTAQTVGRLRSRLAARGEQVVVWHSSLSDGERVDAWLSLAKGEARVVVGARSAVFAPLEGLRLIIVDEEHEPAYKQEETPRYHARDVAVYRAKLAHATCILGSATPSLESLYNAKQGKYKLNKMTQRVDHRQLPKIHVIDMRREKKDPQGGVFISRFLREKLIDRLEKKEQSILFLNRRGFSTSLLCPSCGHVSVCPHCSVTLTYHKVGHRLCCHVCNHQTVDVAACPQCKNQQIVWRGYGTQKVEEGIQKIFPKSRVMRIDTDVFTKKDLFREILADFKRGKIDILVGTQMLAKGLDFPNVTLVGIIDADLSMHVQDFRAGERTFQLLVQVAGRAGRGDIPGDVVVQTFTPFSDPIQFARRDDFEGYFEGELALRKEFHYPPYRHIIRHIFRGRNEQKVQFYAQQWAAYLEKSLTLPLEIRGPAPASIEKIKDHYRYQMWYFTRNVSKSVRMIDELRRRFTWDASVTQVLDVDPVQMS